MKKNPATGQLSGFVTPSGGEADWFRMDVLDTVSHDMRTTFRDDATARPGTTHQFGDYEVLGILGKGGGGIVYHARQPGVEREVAIKSSAHSGVSDLTTRERFQAELRILGKLRHNNIVQIYEAGVHNETPYLVMEYISGGTLSRLIHEQTVSARRAAELLADVARTIHWAHMQGVVHRDLKPSNILLTEDEQPKVADFGIALDAEQSDRLTHTGVRIGTVAYMAPERLADAKHSTAACDIYSLGVMLHELLTGVLPFEGNSLEAALLQIMSRDPLPLQTWSPRLPLELDTICRKCLQKEPERRYQTAGELADDLQRFLDDRPIAAKPARWPEKTQRWCRREPVKASLAGGLLAIVCAALIGLTWGLSVVADVNGKLTTSNSNLQDSVSELKTARDQTEAETQRAEKALDFMVESFHRLDPFQNGRELTVYEVMLQASRELGAQETFEPMARLSLLQTIATTLMSLDEYADALRVLERADKLITKYLDAGEVESLNARHDLALSYRHVGRYKESMELDETVLEIKTAVLGDDDPSTMRTATNLATVYRIMDRPIESIDLFESTLAKQKRLLGDDHLDTLTTLNDLAGTYRSVSRYDDAMRLFKLALAGMTEQLGSEHPETLIAMNNLALVHLNLDESADAIPLLENVLDIRRNKLGNEHDDTLITLSALGSVHHMIGDYPKAIEFYAEVRSGRQKNLGPEHWNTMHATSNLAEMYRCTGNYSQAIELNEFVLEVRLRKIGPEHKHTLATKNNLAAAYTAVGRTEEAVHLLEDVWEARVKVLGADDPATIKAHSKLEVARRTIATRQQTDKTDSSFPTNQLSENE